MKATRALSGAADEIPYLFGVIDQHSTLGYEFEAEHGISSGSIIQFIRMCGDLDKARELVLKFSIKDHILGVDPLSKKGLFIALKSFLTKDSGLWGLDRLEGTLRSVTSESKFNDYNGAFTYVGITDKLGQYHDVRVDDKTYEEALSYVIDSCIIPTVIRPKNGNMDGGLVNHIGSEFLASTFHWCDTYSVFARVEEFKRERPRGIVKGFLWDFERMMFGISKNNQTETDKICQINGTKHVKYFMTEDVIKGFFQIKRGDHEKLYEMGLHVKAH